MEFIANLLKTRQSSTEVDYFALGLFGAGLYFASKYGRYGGDHFRGTFLSTPYVDSTEPQSTHDIFKNSIHEYLVYETSSDNLKLHFFDILKIDACLAKRAERNNTTRDSQNLVDFRRGLKHSLLDFLDCYRNFFQEADVVIAEWFSDREKYRVPVDEWDPLDISFENKLDELKFHYFRGPIASASWVLDNTDFPVLSTEDGGIFEKYNTPQGPKGDALSQSGHGLYYIGDGFMFEVESGDLEHGFEIGEVDEFTLFDSLIQDEASSCFYLLDRECSREHEHGDSMMTFHLFVSESELKKISLDR